MHDDVETLNATISVTGHGVPGTCNDCGRVQGGGDLSSSQLHRVKSIGSHARRVRKLQLRELPSNSTSSESTINTRQHHVTNSLLSPPPEISGRYICKSFQRGEHKNFPILLHDSNDNDDDMGRNHVGATPALGRTTMSHMGQDPADSDSIILITRTSDPPRSMSSERKAGDISLLVEIRVNIVDDVVATILRVTEQTACTKSIICGRHCLFYGSQEQTEEAFRQLEVSLDCHVQRRGLSRSPEQI